MKHNIIQVGRSHCLQCDAYNSYAQLGAILDVSVSMCPHLQLINSGMYTVSSISSVSADTTFDLYCTPDVYEK